MASDYTKGLYNEYELLLSKNDALEAEYKLLRHEYKMIQNENKKIEKMESEISEKNFEINALKKEILRLNALLNTDGSNSGLPTSKTPLSKKKIIPNSRKKGEKKIGGQLGHTKKKLEAFKDNEITEIEDHAAEVCPFCGANEFEKTEKNVNKDELDYEVVVIKRRHHYGIYKCKNCGHEFRQSIANHLKEENQYGSGVKALALSLMNIGNVSINKVRKMIYGLSEEEINPSEGYIVKSQRNAAKELIAFIDELKKKCIELKTLYWDDTVIDISTKRSCLRFYGNENVALYIAHLKKDKAGLDEDCILKLLSKESIVMHDHNRVNYNDDYSYQNIECNVHLLRDLQKTADNLQHKWASELKNLLEKMNSERNAEQEKAAESFSDEYVKSFFERFDQIMLMGIEENKTDFNKYYGKDERTLILRILEYKDNYLSWVVNFELPFSNNLSERALRGIKSKMKVSGQFQNEESANNYAIIKSYIETCYRNGINETTALKRLCEGTPYTLEELFNQTNGI